MKRFLPVFIVGILLISLLFYNTPLLWAQTIKNMTVSAVVPAQVSDYTVKITRLTPTPSNSVFPQDSIITYEITYGSYLPTYNDFTIEAQWDPGTLDPGYGTGQEDVLTYVSNSASDAYDNTPAVIDPVNRTIRWKFDNFPPNTQNQTVTFQLKTNAFYTGNLLVFTPVHARILGSGVITPDSTDSFIYHFLAPPPASSNPPSQTTTSSSAGSSVTGSSVSAPTTSSPTPIPPTKPVAIDNSTILSVSLQTIRSDQAAIALETKGNTTAVIMYGTTPTSMVNTITSLTPSTHQVITLPNLSINTQYYFRIITKDDNGALTNSDIYTFKTASSPTIATIDIPTVFISSNDKLLTLYNTDTTTGIAPTSLAALLPQDTDYDVQFSFDKKIPIKTVQLVTRNKFILGEKNGSQSPVAKTNGDMIEIRPGVFISKLTAPPISGVYELFARVFEVNGNITEQKVSDIIVSPPFQVVDTKGNPIENARVFLYVYKKATQSYVVNTNYPSTNPTFTNFYGKTDLVLPPGTYKAQVSSLGYVTKEVPFTLDRNPENGYPKVVLVSEPFNVVNYIYYFRDAGFDTFGAYIAFFQNLAISSRIFNLTAVTLLWIMIIISFLTFSIKTRTHPNVSITQLGYMLHRLFTRNPSKAYLKGVVFDKKTGSLLSHAQVFVLDNDTKSVLYESYSNSKGSFLLKIPKQSFHIIVIKKAFEPMVIYPRDEQLMRVALHPQTHNTKLHNKLSHTASRFLSMIFETFIVATVVMELFLTQVFGIEKTWPFIALSFLNIVLWFYFLSIKHHKDI